MLFVMESPDILGSTTGTAEMNRSRAREGRYMVNADIVQSRRCRNARCHGDLREHAKAIVEIGLDVVHNDVVDAVATTVFGRAAVGRNSVSNLEAAGNVADRAIPNRDVGDLAGRAHVYRTDGLILWRQQNCESSLREPAPSCFPECFPQTRRAVRSSVQTNS